MDTNEDVESLEKPCENARHATARSAVPVMIPRKTAEMQLTLPVFLAAAGIPDRSFIWALLMELGFLAPVLTRQPDRRRFTLIAEVALPMGARCALATLVAVAGLAGCRTVSSQSDSLLRAPSELAATSAIGRTPSSDSRNAGSAVAAVSYEQPLSSDGVQATDIDDPFAGQSELSLTQLVEQVWRRNPALRASRAVESAAAERYRQVVALDGPVLPSKAWLGFAQWVPWSGKRALRGKIAQAEANAASFDSQEVRLRLAEATRQAYFDYWLVCRNLEINSATTVDFQKVRETANEKCAVGQVTQQDVLQADVELAKLELRRIELEQNERVTVARINTLLHRMPDLPLPAPPRTLEVGHALEQRPELAAQAARIQAEQASAVLASKESFPDQSRRKAADREAMSRLSKVRDNINHDVQTALARRDASRRTVHLYADKILPTAEVSVASAHAGYVAGRVDFLRLIKAERELLELREKHQEAIAAFHRRQAELEHAVGAPMPGTANPLAAPEVQTDE